MGSGSKATAAPTVAPYARRWRPVVSEKCLRMRHGARGSGRAPYWRITSAPCGGLNWKAVASSAALALKALKRRLER